jgi:hypothetical protein
MSTPTTYRLEPYGTGSYPHGTLAVSLAEDRAPGGLSRWIAALAWTSAPGDQPRIVFDAVVLGTQYSTNPDNGAMWALIAATLDYPEDAVYETAPIDSPTWRHGQWGRAHGRTVAAHVTRKGIEALRV